MKVMLFGDSYLPVTDGVVTTMVNYARWLNQDHGRCDVAVPYAPGQDDRVFPYQVFRFASVDTILKRPYRIGVPQADPVYQWKIRRQTCDIVHANSPFIAGDEALAMARRLGVPLVGSFHTKFREDFLLATRSQSFTRFAVSRCVSFFEKCDSVWAVNGPTAGVLRDYGYKGPVEVMPNGCDMAMPEDPDAYRRRVDEWYMLTPGEPVLLFVGRHCWTKNLRVVLDAYALFARHSQARFLMVGGDGASYDEVQAYAKELGLWHRIIFTGKVLDRELLAGLYLRASLFVFPSLYDNAPCVIREAAALGTPSLLIRGSSAAEGFSDNETVFLAENTPESISARMLEIMGNPKLLARVSAKCPAIAVPWRDIIIDVARRYRELIADKNGDIR